MSLAQIRSRVRTLQRRFALALSVVRARRVAERLCQGWTADHADGKPLPDPFQAVAKVREAGIRNAAFIDFQRYIRSCVDDNRCPRAPRIPRIPVAPGLQRRPRPRRPALGRPPPELTGRAIPSHTPEAAYPVFPAQAGIQTPVSPGNCHNLRGIGQPVPSATRLSRAGGNPNPGLTSHPEPKEALPPLPAPPIGPDLCAES